MTHKGKRPKEHPIRYKVELGAYRGAKFLVNLLPETVQLALGRWGGKLGYTLDARHRRVALQNLELAFPEWTLAERKRVAKESFGKNGTAAVELATSAQRDRQS